MSSLLKTLVLFLAFLSVPLPALSQETGASASEPMSMSSPSAGDTAENTLLPQNPKYPDTDLKKIYPDPYKPHWLLSKYPAPGCVRADPIMDIAENVKADVAGVVYFLLALPMLLMMARTLIRERRAAAHTGRPAVHRVWQPGGVWLFIGVLLYSGAMFWFMSPGFIILPIVTFMARLTPEDSLSREPQGFEAVCLEFLKWAFITLGVGGFLSLLETETSHYVYKNKITGEVVGEKTETEPDAISGAIGLMMLSLLFFIFPFAVILYTFAKFQRNYLRSERTED